MNIKLKDFNETCTMHTKSDNIEVMVGYETDQIIEKVFNSPLQRCQEVLEESIRK